MSPIKSLGQNFLVSKTHANSFVNNIKLENLNSIIEIGGGKGAITNVLIENLTDLETKLYVYEIDKFLAIKLYEKYKNNQKIEIVNENFLDADLTMFDNYSVIGAIPYYITSPILHILLKLKNRPKQIVLIVQLEFAEKICAKTPKSNYWTHLTLGYEVNFITKVDKSHFYPSPTVDSAIICFSLIKSDVFDESFTFAKWSKFLHHVYKNPRKMLNKTFDKEMLNSLEIDPTLRPQNLETEQILSLYNYI